jgi:hypothetical protein
MSSKGLKGSPPASSTEPTNGEWPTIRISVELEAIFRPKAPFTSRSLGRPSASMDRS